MFRFEGILLSLDATAAISFKLPMLPNEILIMIIRSFQWTEDVDQLRFLWENLRLVSPMFEEIVRDIFAARDIRNPAALLRLLPKTRLILHNSGRSFLFGLTIFPR